MSRKCSPEDLEALVEGGLSPEDASEINAHAAACAACGDELQWLRTEREMMRRRAARTPIQADQLDSLWSGVEARLVQKPARPWWRPASFATAVAVAAVMAFLAGRRAAEKSRVHAPIEIAQAPAARHITPVSTRSGPENEPLRVLDEAEAEWRSAAVKLEKRFVEQRRHLGPTEAERLDDALARTRLSIAEARVLAGNDVHARVAVIDGYSAYVHSLHTLVSDLEVSR
jgi:hypothetical protein